MIPLHASFTVLLWLVTNILTCGCRYIKKRVQRPSNTNPFKFCLSDFKHFLLVLLFFSFREAY